MTSDKPQGIPFAIMWDLGPSVPNQPDAFRIRRYELDLLVTDAFIYEGAKKSKQVNITENMLRSGYKQLPIDTSLADYAQYLFQKYNGMKPIPNPNNSNHWLLTFPGEEYRNRARQLMQEEGFRLD